MNLLQLITLNKALSKINLNVMGRLFIPEIYIKKHIKHLNKMLNHAHLMKCDM